MPLWRLLGYSGAVSSCLRRGLSTAAASVGDDPRPQARQLAGATRVTPPRRTAAHLPHPRPPHLIDPPPLPDPDSSDTMRQVFGGIVSATSTDGLPLLEFVDLREAAPGVTEHGSDRTRAGAARNGFQVADVTRSVLNPLSGQMFLLPNIIDGMKKTVSSLDIVILTQSERSHQLPDRYAIAVLNDDNDGGQQRLVMRPFSIANWKVGQAGGFAVPVPVPAPDGALDGHPRGGSLRRRLWWVDVGWGVVSADPFSDRPDLHYVELPRGRTTEPVEDLDSYCRVGVSQGRLRSVEVSRVEPFLLDDDGSGWTLEHQVAFSRLWPGECHPFQGSPRIGVIDPLNASIMHLTIDNTILAIDMVKKKLLEYSMISGVVPRSSSFLKACVLPPWLGSIRIPSAGTLLSKKDSARIKTLSEILVCVDKGKKN